MTDDKLFTPEFVYEICVGLAIHDFLTKDLPMQIVSDRYSKGLTEHYRQVSEVEISHPAEEILRFLSEQKKPQYEAHEKANFFVFNRLKFDGIRGCLLYTSPSPRDPKTSRMPSSALRAATAKLAPLAPNEFATD